MTANLPSRSASISTTVDDTSAPLLKGSSFGSKNAALRSASIGSSFFHKDTSNFFTPSEANTSANSANSMDDDLVREPDSAATSENHPSQDATTGDLDIVGAIGNLDLDDDFALPKDSTTEENPESDAAAAAAAAAAASNQDTQQFSQQFPFLYGDSATFQPQFYHPYPHPHQGSVTPNPSIGAFSGPSAFSSTPSSTWNNTYVPSSAPPFAYGNNSENSIPLVKPFELPGEHQKSSENAEKGAIPNLHLPFSTPPPQASSQANAFGGILDSHPSFGGAKEIYVGSTPNGETTPESELDNSFSEGSKVHSSFAGTPFSGVGTPSGSEFQQGDAKLQNHHHQYRQYHPQHPTSFTPPPTAAGGQEIQFSGAKDNFPNMMPNGPNMWNQHPMAPQLHNMRNNFVDNRMSPIHHFSGPNQFGNQPNRYNNSGNSGRRYVNDGMNVHRKMHNNHNRRKGDDASKYANSKLEDFTGEIYTLCKDQHGCRFLQRQLDLGREVAEGKSSSTTLTNDIAATMIFNEIYLKIIELMTDPFGNYLIQKLFENVSSDQRIILVKNAAPDFIRIALDPHGTRALQKLVECISTEEESQLIIDSLSPHIVSLSRDLNGNHVVQKCLQKLKPAENQFIFDAASVNCIEIATHRHGCCVLQRCLDHGDFSQRKQLSLKVAENATSLSLDPFGNYVVQYVLSRGDEDSIRIILDHIKSNVVSLSLHKFGSNVIEKSLRINKLTDSLIEVLLKNEEKFGIMLNDAFGNYVLQTSLDVASAYDLGRLSNALQPLLPNIKNTPHGRRIMTKIQSIA